MPAVAARLETTHVNALRIGSVADHLLEPARCDLADLTLAVAFGYIDFRLPDIARRELAPSLWEWIELLNERPSQVLTRPQVPA